MTNKLVVITNSIKVTKIKKILLYEMKFLVPNYSCLQNPWLGGYRPQIPVLSVLCPQLNVEPPPPPEQHSWVRHCHEGWHTANHEELWVHMAEIYRFKVSTCYSQNTRHSLKYFGVKFVEFNAWKEYLATGETETLVKKQRTSHTKAAKEERLSTTYPSLDEPLQLFEACLLRKVP